MNIMNNLYLIISEDCKKVEFYLRDILEKTHFSDNNKVVYDLDDVSFSNILDEASMISLFDSQKLIIGNNFDLSKLGENDIEYLKKYLNAKSNDVCIILVASKIDARKSGYKLFKDNFNIIDTSKVDNNMTVFDYVKKAIMEKKYQMSDNDINYLILKIGNDINNIDLELNKLFMYKNEDKVINIDDIELLIADSIDNVIYEFTNAVIEKDYNKIALMYHNFKIQNVSFDYLIAILANSFHQLLTIKILNNDGKSNLEIAKVIGKKEFYVKKTIERLYQYTVDDLAKYINDLAVVDRNFKTGKSNIDELELLLLSK